HGFFRRPSKVYARASSVGGAIGVCARLWRIPRFHLVAHSGPNRIDRNRSVDRAQRPTFRADLGGSRDRCRPGRLGLVLDRTKARIHGPTSVAPVPSSRTDTQRRSVREKVGRARGIYRPLLWATASRCARRRWYF